MTANTSTASGQTTSDSSLIDPAARQQFGLLKWLIEWTFSSKQKLRQAEKVLLAQLKTPYQAYFIDIGNVVDVDGSEQIWTLSLTNPQAEERRLPLVVLHGQGMGLAMWYPNLDDWAKQRKVYALDILGFGRSTRPVFSATSELCECQLITALEEWRQQLKIDEFILLGHSFGAYLASCYALTHPDHDLWLTYSKFNLHQL
ncbi:uncharacterized protein Dwil_GK14854 [Drosophila willistoni]|uniref:AB hydrolase-1 domain-containing protein n=1 Tax=Drosophila willistoni TaxID=7260 RepID=B4MUG2_DROWI|nr:uncharacterized protein Dwil_GK14854 [Drosophila willistoni]